MFEKILEGVAPSEVFKRMIEAEPNLDNWDLSHRFAKYFLDADVIAQAMIWRWERPGGRPGIADVDLDRQLIALLRKAGYPVPDPRNPGTP